ncbi:MAG TPA: hypothetical protein VGB77_02540 [Abditibacteriaceae bacterium]|jgi:hypothetical protein
MKPNIRILSKIAVVAGLVLMPALGGLNDAQAKDKGNKGHKASGRHDNGKHKGWTKGKHKGWSKSSQTWDRDDDDRRDRRDRRTSTRRPTVRDTWTRPTTSTGGRLIGTHYHSTQAAAAAAVRYAQSKGYRATSTYSGPGRWIVRVYTR